MSGHHDEHPLQGQKPVSFTVPFILAAVLILIIMLFLSLCDPNPHHGHDAAHEGHGAATEAAHHNNAAAEAHQEAAAVEAAPAKDSASATTMTMAAEPAQEAEGHH